jgi:lysophospholipase L1-like esterase
MNQIFKLFVGLVLIIAIAACSEQPQLNAVSTDSVILAFGDSLTEGVGAKNPTTESYPAVLAAMIGQPIINSGISGEVSSEGLVRLREELEEFEPDLVILCHGGNDLIRKLDQTSLKNNLKSMVSAIKASGADVVLIAVPSFNVLAKVPDLYEEVAEEFNIPIDTDSMRSIEISPQLKADPIHPNVKGYRQMANAVYELLSTHGALTDAFVSE